MSLMPKARVMWIVLILLAFGTFSFFSLQAGYKGYHYLVYSQSAVPQTLHWKVKEIKEGRFQIEVSYWFTYLNKKYQHSYTFKGKEFGNKALAYEQIQFLQQKPWTVWISKWNPEESSLERGVPLSLTVRAFLSFVVFAYFLFLRSYFDRSEEIEGKRFEF